MSKGTAEISLELYDRLMKMHELNSQHSVWFYDFTGGIKYWSKDTFDKNIEDKSTQLTNRIDELQIQLSEKEKQFNSWLDERHTLENKIEILTRENLSLKGNVIIPTPNSFMTLGHIKDVGFWSFIKLKYFNKK